VRAGKRMAELERDNVMIRFELNCLSGRLRVRSDILQLSDALPKAKIPRRLVALLLLWVRTGLGEGVVWTAAAFGAVSQTVNGGGSSMRCWKWRSVMRLGWALQ
jgi:hypothetical protein